MPCSSPMPTPPTIELRGARALDAALMIAVYAQTPRALGEQQFKNVAYPVAVFEILRASAADICATVARSPDHRDPA